MRKLRWFGIGIYNGKSPINIGTLWRHAWIYGADFCFTVNKRYTYQSTDTQNTENKIPIFHYQDMSCLLNSLPANCDLVAVEQMSHAWTLPNFNHIGNCVYLLGAEDRGLPEEVIGMCRRKVTIPSKLDNSLNVAVAGTIIMYDRYIKLGS